MVESASQRKASLRYKKENTKSITITFFPKDMDLYNYMKGKPNKAEYLRNLIREDMKSGS